MSQMIPIRSGYNNFMSSHTGVKSSVMFRFRFILHFAWFAGWSIYWQRSYFQTQHHSDKSLVLLWESYSWCPSWFNFNICFGNISPIYIPSFPFFSRWPLNGEYMVESIMKFVLSNHTEAQVLGFFFCFVGPLQIFGLLQQIWLGELLCKFKWTSLQILLA